MPRAKRSIAAAGSGLLLLLAWAVGPPAYLAWRAGRSGLVFAGADGPFAGDQFQYLSWVRDGVSHLLVANLYDVGPPRQVFLHPMFAVSAQLVRMGVSVPLSYLVWKPFAIAVLFAGAVVYARRTMDTGGARIAVVALALFYVAPTVFLLDVPQLSSSPLILQAASIGGEMFSAGFLAGYLPTAIAVGLMPLFFIGLERAVQPERRHPGRPALWYVGWTAAAGGLIAWLHPWQGEVLLLVVVGLLVKGPDRRGLAPHLLLAAIAVAAPLAYYYALAQFDPSWHVARVQNQGGTPPVAAAVIPLLPLALPALFAVGGRNLDLQERIVRLWPLAIMAGFLLAGPFAQHVFESASLPLAVLAVRAVLRAGGPVIRRWGRPALAVVLGVAGVAALTLPGMVFDALYFRDQVRSESQPFLITTDERAATDYLAGRQVPGPVLTALYLGQAVPALTGRQTWVGHPSWSPDFQARADVVQRLFDGRLTPAEAERVVADSGARFVLADCRARADLSRALAPRLENERHFGCATVYELRGS